jgi:PAS domain S-box-containing protein
MKDKSFNLLFDEGQRQSRIFKRYLHYTQPGEPSGPTFTKFFVILWAILRIDFLIIFPFQKFWTNEALELFRRVFGKINAYLPKISDELSIICAACFGFILGWILYCFCVIIMTKNLHLTFRRSLTVRVLKVINGLFLLGLSNIIWVIYWLRTYSGSSGAEVSRARDGFGSVLDWILVALGIFFTGYTFFLFYWISPFFPSRNLKTFKRTYSSDLARFVLVLCFIFLTKLENIGIQTAEVILFVMFLCQCWIVYDMIRHNYFEKEVDSFVLFIEGLFCLDIFFINFEIFGQKLTSYKIRIGIGVAGLVTMFLMAIKDRTIPFSKMKNIVNRDELGQKNRLLKLLIGFNFRLKRPLAKNIKAIQPEMTVADYPLDSLSTIISHKQNCSKISCVCHEIVTAQSNRSPESKSVSQSHLINIFYLQVLEHYIEAHPSDNEMMIWYIKFLFAYFKNYSLMLCQMKTVNRVQLSSHQKLQLYSIEEETIYNWRYRDLDTINGESIVIEIFRFADFVIDFNKLKTKACSLLYNYMALARLLQNRTLTIEAIDGANKNYHKAKIDYLQFKSKLKLESMLFKFHNEICSICIPELRRQNRFTELKKINLQGSKIIYSDKSSYLFMSLDNDRRGIIMNANKNIDKVVGYTANNLVGRLVNKIIPDEISTNHDSFLRSYIRTAKGTLINAIKDLFLIHKNGFIIPVTIYLKNFLSSGDSSACVLAFFKMKDEKRDLMFASPQGRILNITERFDTVTRRSSNIGLKDAYIQALMPKVRSLFRISKQNGSVDSIAAEIEKIKGHSKICHGVLYVTHLLLNSNAVIGTCAELASVTDLKILKPQKNDDANTEIMAFGTQTKKQSNSSFKVRFEVDFLPTSIGVFFLFAFSSIWPNSSRVTDSFFAASLNLHRITLLKRFVQNLIRSREKKAPVSFINDKKIERNLLRMNTMNGTPIASTSAKAKVSLEVKALEELNVAKITEKKMFWFDLLLVLKIVLVFAIYLSLTLALYFTSLETFKALQGSFDIAENRNYIYNFMSILGLLNYHQRVPASAAFTRAMNSTDYAFLPTTRNYTDQLVTELLTSNIAFAQIQKDFFMKKLTGMSKLEMESNVAAQVNNANNFLPYLPVGNVNGTSNLYDMFIFFNYYMNKNKMSYAKYLSFSINAYRLTEEYGLVFEPNQFLATIQSKINVVLFAMLAFFGAILVLYVVIIVIIIRFFADVAYFYSLTALISFSKNKINSIKAFIKSNELVLDYHRFNVKPVKSSNTRKWNFKIYKGLLITVLVMMTGFLLIAFVMLVAEVLGLSNSLKSAVMEGENVINSILNIDFLVAKTFIGLQDNLYPRRTQIRIFYKKFINFFNGGFSEELSFVSSIKHIGTDQDLCPLIAGPLKFGDCEQIMNGIFTKGYSQVSAIILHEMTEAFTNRLTFYRIHNFEVLGKVFRGFLYATQIIGESFKIGVEESVESFSRMFLSLIFVSFSFLVASAILVRHRVRKVMEETMTTSLLLLLHIKPRVMLINSKLLRIFK